MKTFLRILSGLLFLFAVIFLLYGSVKTVEGDEIGTRQTTLDDGIVLVQENQAQAFGDIALRLSLGCFLGGVVVFFVSRGVGSSRVR